jgi:hypothetical protein
MTDLKSLLGLGAASLLAANSFAQQPLKHPNILWISTEDMSPHLGCYGDPVARTPNIDRLASQGTRFTNVFTTAAISAPVRAGVITGMYSTSIGCMHMRTTSYRRSADNPIEFTAVPPHYVKAFTEYMRLQDIIAPTIARQITSSQKILFLRVSGTNVARKLITGTVLTRVSHSLLYLTGLVLMRVKTGIFPMLKQIRRKSKYLLIILTMN